MYFNLKELGGKKEMQNMGKTQINNNWEDRIRMNTHQIIHSSTLVQGKVIYWE